MFSGIEKTYEVFSTDPTATNPAFNIICVGNWTGFGKFILNEIFAIAEVLDLGTYPMFLDNETIFSLSVAESKKDSFTIIFELNAVI